MIDHAAQRTVSIDDRSVSIQLPLRALPDQPLRYGLRGLALQPALPFPVCFLLDGAGVLRLRAEVPRALPTHECEKLAGEALDATLGAVAGGCASREPNRAAAPLADASADAVIQTLLERGLACERTEQGCAIRGGEGLPIASRIVVEPFADAQALQVASQATLRLNDASGLHAMARYALELNHRLRFARVAVDGVSTEVVRVVWQSVLPAAIPLDRTLVPAVEAVAVAREVSSRVFAALGSSNLADAYLSLRFADPSRQGPEVGSESAVPPTERPRDAVPRTQ